VCLSLHLLKSSLVKLVRDPISVGIDPERELKPEWCGVGNTIRGKQSSIGER